MTLDLAHLRSWIGRVEEATDLVTPRLVAEYRATFEPHLAPTGEGEAPPMLHWCLAPPTAPMAAVAADGHAGKGGFLPPVPLPRRMWAGGRIEIHASLREGDRVLRRSRIADVSVKEGRTGRLCFVTVAHEVETGRGLALIERQDIVYREAAEGGPAPSPAAPPAPAPRPDLAWTVEPSPVLLFRYSAMTFNGHRIHYDGPYVTGVEGYDGLVVHGPLQASLLFNLAATLAGRTPAAFEHRGLSPLTAPAPFRVCGARGADGAIRCWTEAADGRVCMRGDALF